MVRGEHLFGDWPQASAIGFVFGHVFRPRCTPSREFRNAPEWAAAIRPTQSIFFLFWSLPGRDWGISKNMLTHRSVQICMNSAVHQRCVLFVLLCMVHFGLTVMVRRKWSVPVRYQLPKDKSTGLAFQYLCMMDGVGRKTARGLWECHCASGLCASGLCACAPGTKALPQWIWRQWIGGNESEAFVPDAKAFPQWIWGHAHTHAIHRTHWNTM